MKEEFYEIDTAGAELKSIDSDLLGNYIAITDKGEVVSPFSRLYLSGKLAYPIIRHIDSQTFLVASRRASTANNAFIYSYSGQLLQSFFAGDGIEDVVVVDNKLVFTYFDEGVFGSKGPNNEGVAIFDFSGKLLYGFNSNNQHIIADCYAICKLSKSKVLLYVYTGFPLIELNTDTFKSKTYQSPDTIRGAHAMSSYYGQVVFHGGYNNNSQFHLWDIWKKEATIVGSYNGYLKGLENGKFLSEEKNGFTIVSPLDG